MSFLIDVSYSPDESLDWRLVDSAGKEAESIPVSLIAPFQIGSSITLPSYSTLRLVVGEGNYQGYRGLVFNIGSQWWKVVTGDKSVCYHLGCRFENAKPEMGSGTHRPMWKGELVIPGVPLPVVCSASTPALDASSTR